MEQPESPSPTSPPQNGKLALLQTLASSGDNWVKLGTLALVALSGIGNFLTTKDQGHRNRHEVEAQTHEIWQALNRNKDDFRELVRDAGQSRSDIATSLNKQGEALRNQAEMLSNQQKIL